MTNNRRKIALIACLVLSFMMLFVLSSCTGDEPSANDDIPNSTQIGTNTDSTDSSTDSGKDNIPNSTQTGTNTDSTDSSTNSGKDDSNIDTGDSSTIDSSTDDSQQPDSNPEPDPVVTYTVTFVQEGFADVVKTVTHGQALIDIPEPQAIEGYNVAWEDVDLTNVTGNIVVLLQKSPITYKINYELNGGINNPDNPQSYSIEDLNKELYAPTKSNEAIFGGWYTTKDFAPETVVEAINKCYYDDITLYAYWIEYRIEEAEGFEIETEESIPKLYKIIPNSIENVDLNQAFKVSNGCTWKLYMDFQGENEYKLKSMTLSVGENKAYIVVFHPDGEHWSRYELILYRLDMMSYSFISDGVPYENCIAEEQSNVEAPATNPQKTGYDFICWTVNGKEVSFPYQMNVSTIFEAKYSPIQYELKYNLNNGVNNTNNPKCYTIEQSITLLKPTRQHYDFVGWYDNAQFNGSVITEIVKGSHGHKTLYAKWTPTDYDINYELNGGVNNEENPSTYNIEISVDLKAPSKSGFSFAGWYSDNSFSNKVTSIPIGESEAKTFYARWTANENTLIFDGNGATNGTMEPLKISTDYSVTLTSASFERRGYTFLGWSTTKNGNVDYIDGATYTMGTSSTYTLYAVWEAIQYTITYEKNWGTGGYNNPITFTIEDLPISLGILNDRTNHLFNSWYKESDFSGTPITQITDIGDIKLYAEYLYCTQGLGLEENDNSYTVSYYVGSDSHVVIPRSYRGKSITAIAEKAFNNCTSIKSITIPNGITTVGERAFYLSSVSSVTYLGTIEQWCNIAFSDASANPMYHADEIYINKEWVKQEIILPNTLTKINSYAFVGFSMLESIKIPNSVNTIGSSAFIFSTSLTIYCESEKEQDGWDTNWNAHKYPVVWNSCNNEIANDGNIYAVIDGIRYALKDDMATVSRQRANIGDVNIPASIIYKEQEYAVTAINASAFYECQLIRNVTIGNSVKAIGNQAFYFCASLTSVTIGEGVTTIGDSAFKYCKSLTSITIPKNVITIGHYAFEGCEYLEKVTIEGNVNTIGARAFNRCFKLTSIIIPNSVETIGGKAFAECSKLTIRCEAASQPSGWSENWNYSNCPVYWGCVI